MKIQTLKGLGFARVESGDFNRIMGYMRKYVCAVNVTYERDEDLKDVYISWKLSKEDFESTFGLMDNSNFTTIIAYNHEGKYYLRWANYMVTLIREINRHLKSVA